MKSFIQAALKGLELRMQETIFRILPAVLLMDENIRAIVSLKKKGKTIRIGILAIAITVTLDLRFKYVHLIISWRLEMSSPYQNLTVFEKHWKNQSLI